MDRALESCGPTCDAARSLISTEAHRDRDCRDWFRVALRGDDPGLALLDVAAQFERAIDAYGVPAPGGRLGFSATAYCKGFVTSSGVAVQSGILAADPSLLPVGSVVSVDISNDRYDGVYTVLDTGRRCRAARWTFTCGAATRRFSSAVARLASA